MLHFKSVCVIFETVQSFVNHFSELCGFLLHDIGMLFNHLADVLHELLFAFKADVRHLGEGFVKMIAHEKTDEILGVHIVNTHASELIAEAVVAMEFRASSEDIARIVHAHPSLSEVMHEAALAVDKRALNM